MGLGALHQQAQLHGGSMIAGVSPFTICVQDVWLRQSIRFLERGIARAIFHPCAPRLETDALPGRIRRVFQITGEIRKLFNLRWQNGGLRA